MSRQGSLAQIVVYLRFGGLGTHVPLVRCLPWE
jgi:hypothetical protein